MRAPCRGRAPKKRAKTVAASPRDEPQRSPSPERRGAERRSRRYAKLKRNALEALEHAMNHVDVAPDGDAASAAANDAAEALEEAADQIRRDCERCYLDGAGDDYFESPERQAALFHALLAWRVGRVESKPCPLLLALLRGRSVGREQVRGTARGTAADATRIVRGVVTLCIDTYTCSRRRRGKVMLVTSIPTLQKVSNTVFVSPRACRTRRASPADIPWRRVAATPWVRRGYSEGGSRRRRGRDVDIPWRRVAATPRPRRGYSVETGRARRYARELVRRARRGDEIARRTVAPSAAFWTALKNSGREAELHRDELYVREVPPPPPAFDEHRHAGVICDGCDKRPIVGARYHLVPPPSGTRRDEFCLG